MNDGKLSRRKILALGASMAALPTLGAVDRISSQKQSASTRVRIIDASSEEFTSKLQTHFPGILASMHFQQIQPLAVLITHEEGPPVHAYSIEWNLTSSSGDYKTALLSYAHPGSKMHRAKATNAKGHKLRTRTVFSAQTSILRLGDLVLVTPFVKLTPAQYTKFQDSWHLRISTSQPGAFLLAELPLATKTGVSLDAVVFRNRSIHGPDSHRLAKHLAIRRNAEHDVALKVRRLLKGGADATAVQTALEDEASSIRSSPSGSAKDIYQLSRKRHAQFILSLQTAIPYARFTKAVRRMTRLHKTKLKPVAS